MFADRDLSTHAANCGLNNAGSSMIRRYMSDSDPDPEPNSPICRGPYALSPPSNQYGQPSGCGTPECLLYMQ